ncbi:hypothetical protein K438DRAFT_1779181 [Mycena galopus ATCC 62051]|nr:hypothetical protein K438DRAFT_1779181 [Mycena galopus ATCC 62051]
MDQQVAKYTSDTSGAVPHNRAPSDTGARPWATRQAGERKAETNKSVRSTPTTAAATLPGGANTSARGASDTQTDEILRTPTPAPGRAPSRQGSVAASSEAPPPVPANQPRVGSLPPPPATTLPFSPMVVDAAEAVARPAIPPIDAGPTAAGKGKGKAKEADEPAANDKTKGKETVRSSGSPFVAPIGASGERRRPSLFDTELSQLDVAPGADLLSPLEGVGATPGHPTNPLTAPDDDSPPLAMHDQDDPHFQADLNPTLVESMRAVDDPSNPTSGASTSTAAGAPTYANTAAHSGSSAAASSKRKNTGSGSPPKRAKSDQRDAQETSVRTAEKLATRE